ncbi:MAG: pyridoxal phosphate-dependent aminotransferase, partial [bacterium]
MQIANRINNIEASKTLQVKEKALQLKAKGIKVIDLTAGEPDFQTPELIAQAGIRAIQEGFTKYTANTGIPELRTKIAQKLHTDNNLDYTPEQIIVSNGAKQSILNALLSIVNEGDEVILPSPYWVSYPEQIKIAGGTPVIVDTRYHQFKLSPSLLQQHITPNTRVLILNSPSNPTGVVYSKSELSELAEVLKNENIWIISDEIYEKIIFDGLQHTSIAALGNLIEKSIVINGFSKSYSMTGWRVGYAAAPLPVVKAMSKIQGHSTSNASSISQKAALAALQESDAEVEKMRKTFEERRNFIQQQLDSRPYFSYIYPQGAFYFFINISKSFGKQAGDKVIENSLDFSTYVTENYHMVSVPGIAFGANDYIRLSFA